MNIGTGEKILTVLWIGSLWTIGYMVAPTLFQVLDDRDLAGMVAGRLFTLESYLGLLCGGALLLIEFLAAPSPKRFNWHMGLLSGMLAIILVGQFVLQPMMAAVKAQGLSQAPEFGRLHGIASILYLVNSLLGLVWVVFPRRIQGN
jgi:hypothetical protein